jgi:hypothetical protein
MGAAAAIKARVRGESRTLSFDEALRVARELYGEIGEAEDSLLRRRVRLGAFLLQVHRELEHGRWMSWLEATDIHEKTAQSACGLAAQYADAHGELDLDSLLKAVDAYNAAHPNPKHQLKVLPRKKGTNTNHGSDLRGEPTLRQAEIAAGVRKPFVIDENLDDAWKPPAPKGQEGDGTLGDEDEEQLDDETADDFDEGDPLLDDEEREDDDVEMRGSAGRVSRESPGQDRGRVPSGAFANSGATTGATPGGAARSTGRGPSLQASAQLTFGQLYEQVASRAKRALESLDAGVRDRARALTEEYIRQMDRVLGGVV